MKTITKICFPALALLVLACNKQVSEIQPLTKITVAGELATVSGVQAATIGNYAFLAGNYEYYGQDLGEDRGNNVTQQTPGPVSQATDAFFYQNSNNTALGYSYGFYQACYSVIENVNTVLDNISSFDTTSLTDDDKNNFLYAKGENIFMRALSYFSLVRIYGKPYYQDGGVGLSVPLKKTSALSDRPTPSSVKDVYTFIISELQTAAQLMKAPVTKNNTFVSTGAAWSLLSRVYLYMGGSIASPDAASNQLAVTYADSVIDQSGGKYTLVQGTAYQNMFGDDEDGSLGRSDPSGNAEIIFAIDNSASIYGTSIGQIYHRDPEGYGATFLPSSDLKSQYATGDNRKNFFELNASTGYVETTKWTCLPYYGGTKAAGILFRLAELYLNRAEANAKLGNIAAAKADLKAIHIRAGLPGTDIDNLADADVITAILQERRIELAFEGHNSFDYYRNGLPMTRLAADFNGTALTIQPDDPKVVFTIPAN